MLSNSELQAAASSYVNRRWGRDWVAVRPFELSEPDGVFYWVERTDHAEYLDGPVPFFVFTDTGRIVQFTNPILLTALNQRIATQPGVVRAVAQRQLPGSGHERAYADFVRECLLAAEAASAHANHGGSGSAAV